MLMHEYEVYKLITYEFPKNEAHVWLHQFPINSRLGIYIEILIDVASSFLLYSSLVRLFIKMRILIFIVN